MFLGRLVGLARKTTACGKRREVDKHKPLFIQVGRRLVLFHAAWAKSVGRSMGTPFPLARQWKAQVAGTLECDFPYYRDNPFKGAKSLHRPCCRLRTVSTPVHIHEVG